MPEIRAKVDCFGFKKRYWTKGETTTIGQADKLPANFEYAGKAPERPVKSDTKADK